MPSSSQNQKPSSREVAVPSTVLGDNHLSVLSDVSESMIPEHEQQQEEQEPPSTSAQLAQSFVPISSSNEEPPQAVTTLEGNEESGSPQPTTERGPSATQASAHQEEEQSLDVVEATARSETNEGPRFKDQSHSFLESRSGNTTSASPSSRTTATLLSSKSPMATYTPNILQDQEVTPGLVEAQAILVPIEETENEQEDRKGVSTLTERVRLRLFLLAMVTGAAIAVLITCTTGNCSSSSSSEAMMEDDIMMTDSPTASPTESPSVDPVRASTVASMISGASSTDVSYPSTTDTAEALSLKWLIEDDPLQLSVTDGIQRLTQRYAMGVLWISLFGTSPPGLTECSWDGVRACVNGVIGQVQMERVAEASVGGTLPPDLSLLSELTNVSMPDMNLVGTLPESYGRWTTLEELYLEQNQLTGSLPASYQDMELLRVLSVHKNSLNGTIPSAYSAWTSLERLLVAENQLTGSIPEAWPFLQDLWGHDNGFTGSLPSSSWINGELRNLVLYNNRLSGSIPESLVANNVELFELHKNQLTGTIPAAFSRWTNATDTALKTFYIYDNAITGSMPLCDGVDTVLNFIAADCAVECSCCRGCVS